MRAASGSARVQITSEECRGTSRGRRKAWRRGRRQFEEAARNGVCRNYRDFGRCAIERTDHGAECRVKIAQGLVLRGLRRNVFPRGGNAVPGAACAEVPDLVSERRVLRGNERECDQQARRA